MANFWQTPIETLQELLKRKAPHLRQIRHFPSACLNREVDIDVYLPPDYHSSIEKQYPLILFNDGQDLPPMLFRRILERLYAGKKIEHLIAVGIHANAERHREYGTARQADYKGRGDKAAQHRDFVVQELLPFLHKRFRVSNQRENTAFAGFSLGGLSAMDIAWNHPDIFGAAGVFSGALWWRWSAVDPRHPDSDRIMHDIIHNSSPHRPGQQFWFQCGTCDETEDRNNNGVIDSIDDTLDLIKALKGKQVSEQDIHYFEMEGGTHDTKTWSLAMPVFLRTLFENKAK